MKSNNCWLLASFRKSTAILVLFGVLIFASPGSAQNMKGGTRSDHRNIIFILADDLGYSELGSYGNRFNETPNLDRLAKQSLRFTHAYAAAAICSPTRAALMTGQYPARIGITNFLDEKDKRYLSPTYTTLNEPLQRAGYKTGIIGKWHLTGDYTAGPDKQGYGRPQLHGWNEVRSSETIYIGPGDYVYPYFFMPNEPEREPEMTERDASSPEYLTDRQSGDAVDFIRRHKEGPFFLYLPFYAVHTTLADSPERERKYAAKPGAGETKNNPKLAAMLERIDKGVGRVMKTLDDLGLSDNTILIFTSDNGGETRVTTNAPLRGGKSELYEGGIREPLLIRYPRLIKAGGVTDTPIMTQDFYPTLIELANAEFDRSQKLDGISFVSLLSNPNSKRRENLYWFYPLDKPHFLGGRSSGALQSGDYKMIEFYDDNHAELYDLKNDPSESIDLSNKMPKKLSEMQKRFAAWRKSVTAEKPRYETERAGDLLK